MSYARRYGLLAAFGIAPDDDDGNAAVTHSKAQAAMAEPMIDQTQRGIITDLAAAADVNILTIVESYNAKSIDGLTAKQADAVIKRLNLTIDKKTQEKEA